MNLTDLYKNKREAFYAAQKIIKIAEDEGRMVTADERKLFDDAMAKMNEIQEVIDREEKLAEVQRSLGQPIYNKNGEQTDTIGERTAKMNAAINKWARLGNQGLNPEERALLGAGKDQMGEAIQLRAVGNLTNGTYVQTTDVMQTIETAKKYYAGWFDAVTEWRTPKGNQVEWPTVDDTSYTGALEAAGTDGFDNSDAVTLARKTFNAYIYSSQGITVNNSDLEDADFDLNTAIGQVLGERLWRAIATAAMTGTGSSQPQGLARAAAKGLLTGDCTITYARLLQFMKTVDWANLQGPKSGFMFHQSQYFDLLSLTATTGQSLWQPSLAQGAPPTFMGLKWWVANELTATSVTSALSRHMILGDFSKFVIRYAGPTMLVRLTERYAELFRTGFIAIQRFDSERIWENATTYASVKYLRRMGT
jgi:HK97 family phage major capsid protein